MQETSSFNAGDLFISDAGCRVGPASVLRLAGWASGLNRTLNPQPEGCEPSSLSPAKPLTCKLRNPEP